MEWAPTRTLTKKENCFELGTVLNKIECQFVNIRLARLKMVFFVTRSLSIIQIVDSYLWTQEQVGIRRQPRYAYHNRRIREDGGRILGQIERVVLGCVQIQTPGLCSSVCIGILLFTSLYYFSVFLLKFYRFQ